jgi:hypothetical protein
VSGLKAIGNAVSVGVLRTQYSQLLVENLPAVADFIKSPSDDWADVKLAMRQSATDYQEPMRSLDAWKYGEVNMTTGHQWAMYAIDLAGRSDEQRHRETTEEHTVDGPSTVNGRLGVGDRQIDKSVDASSAGGFFDVYVIRLTAPAKVAIQMACVPCRPQLNVFDQSQKAVASNDGGIGKPAKIEKSLPAGTYTVFAGTFNGQVGNYSMSIKY